MVVVRRFLAAMLALISLALAIHFVGSELYGAYLAQPHLVWDYLNWLTALGIVVTLVHHFQRKRAFDRSRQDDAVTFSYLSTNLLLFGAMFLALWFFANWFEELAINDESSMTVIGFIWITFNACFVVLGSISAWQLWHQGYDAGESEGNTLGHDQYTPPSSMGSSLEAQTGSPIGGDHALPPGGLNSMGGGDGATTPEQR